jgi:hypothetical protein
MHTPGALESRDGSIRNAWLLLGLGDKFLRGEKVLCLAFTSVEEEEEDEEVTGKEEDDDDDDDDEEEEEANGNEEEEEEEEGIPVDIREFSSLDKVKLPLEALLPSL